MGNVGERGYPKEMKSFLLAISAALLLIFGSVYFTPLIFDSYNSVHQPPTECSEIKQNEVFCEERYFDDGRVRFSSRSTEPSHCCIMERYMILDERTSYKVLACGVHNERPISCDAVQSYGISSWVVDGRSLIADTSWPLHENQYIDNKGE